MTLALMLLVASLTAARPGEAAELPKPLLDAYLQVQADLAADKMDSVQSQAATIEASASALGSDAAALSAAAKTLQAARDIAAARKAFAEVSEALLAYADATKTELPSDVRVAYCPMVNKPWLQKEQSLRNPYYGKSMLTCGSFKTPR
jgi:hypothetical protein